MPLLVVGVLWLASNGLAYNLNPKHEQLGRMANSLYGWSLQHFDNKLYVGAPMTDTPTRNAVTECSLTQGRCNPVSVGGSSGLEPGDWMGGAMAASEDKLYVCASLQHRRYWAKPAEKGGSVTGSAITGACYKRSKRESQLTQEIDFFKFDRTCPATATQCTKQDKQNLYPTYGHWRFRKGGGNYGFTAAISDDNQKLVAGNPTQRTYVWEQATLSSKAFACGAVGEVSSGNVWKAPGSYHHQDTTMKQKDTAWFGLDTAYLKENHVSGHNNIGKHASFSLARGKFLSDSSIISFVMGAPNADDFKGAVYLCTDCFGRNPRVKATMGVDHKSFTSKDHLQMGEGFGWSVAACDLNDDGLDDLIVGSPMYSDPSDEDKHNTGRVHFFLSTSEDTQWRSIDGATQMLDTWTLDLQSGARFGSAVSCLGDTDGDGKQELAVGSPFFSKTQGAVFIYEYRNGQMQLSQEILMSEKSFGMRLSPDRLTKTMSVPGLGVGAPEVGKAFYLKIRPTVSFELQDKVVNIVPERIHKEEQSFTLQVDPTVQWSDPEWASADFKKLDGLQLTVNITVTPIGQTRSIEGIGGTKEKSQRVTLGSRPGNRTVEFRYENYATRFGNNEKLDFTVKIRYELPRCSQSYRNNCPLFPDHLDDKIHEKGHTAILPPSQDDSQKNRVAIVTLRPQDSQFPINFCESVTCQCNVQLEIQKEASIVAGKDNIGEGALLATLRLQNTGTETAYNIKVTIRLGVNDDLFDLADPRCTQNLQKHKICKIKIVEKGTTATLEVRLKSRKTLSTQMSRITATINTETDCATAHSPPAQVVDVKVVQKWAIWPKAENPSEKVVWDYNNEGAGTYPIKMLYTISNQGPSIATAPKVYVLMPTHQRWLPTSNGVVVPPTLEGATCTKATLTDELKNKIGADGDSGDDDVSLSCYPSSQATGTGCQVFQCSIPGEMAAKESNVGSVHMMFNKTAVVNDKEGRTVFSVKAIVCADTSDDGTKTIVCNQEGKSTVQFDYYPLSISGVIVDNWELVGGAIIGIIVIIITFLIFWRCNCFQKVRIYNNAMNDDGEEEEGDGPPPEGPEHLEMEDVELR